jgi:TonB family protein
MVNKQKRNWRLVWLGSFRIASILILLSSCFTSLLAQNTMEVIKRENQYTYTVYYLIKWGKSKGLKHGPYKKYKHNAVVERGQYSYGKKIGEWKTTRDDNAILQFFVNDVLDSLYGVIDGELVGEKYKNGVVIRSTRYVGKTRHISIHSGDSTLYFKVHKTPYKVDTLTKGTLIKGQKHGKWVYTNPDNTKAVERFDNGNKIGLQSSFTPDGNLLAQHLYSNASELLEKRIFYSSNQEVMLYQMVRDNQSNTYTHTVRYPNNQVFYIATLKDKLLQNYTEFDEAGNQILQSQVRNGEGNVLTYNIINNTRVIATKSQYRNGLKNGLSTIYSSDTAVRIAKYRNGIEIELIKQSSPEDRLIQDTMFYWQYFPLMGLNKTFLGLDKTFETRAEYYLGDFGLREHIENQINYPRLALENEVQGKVQISFVVNKDGTISNLEPIGNSYLGFGLEDEAIRVLELTSGKWSPATQYGFQVKMRFKIPVNFYIF